MVKAVILVALLAMGAAGCEYTVSSAYRGTASVHAGGAAPESQTQTVQLNRCPVRFLPEHARSRARLPYTPGLLGIGDACSIPGHWNQQVFFGGGRATCTLSVGGREHVVRVTEAIARLDARTSGDTTDVDTGFAHVTIRGDELHAGDAPRPAIYNFLGPRTGRKASNTQSCDAGTATRVTARAP
jgi:hypothetical protein